MARYRGAMTAGEGQEWQSEGPGRLSWWRLGLPFKKDEDELVLDTGRPLIGMDERSNVSLRPGIELKAILRHGASSLGWLLDDLRSRKRSPLVVTVREVLAWLAVDLYGFQVGIGTLKWHP